jgi:outer membrane protein assembly factor BamB
LDKNVYCVNLNDAKLRWKFETTGRIFSKPSIIGNNVYVGSNDGIMYEIDFEKGKMKSTMQLTERITNKIVYNEETKRFFVLTQANELYCLSRKAIASSFETISVDKNLE